MDWETLVQDLNEQQRYLRRIVAASKEQQEVERPGSDFNSLVSTDPGALLPMVKQIGLIRTCLCLPWPTLRSNSIRPSSQCSPTWTLGSRNQPHRRVTT